MRIGKIYKLTSNHTDKIYIGSTIKSLYQRFKCHQCNFYKYIKNINNRYTTSFEILCNIDCRIELIENLINPTKEELLKRESHYIKLYKNIGLAVNKNIPYREEGEYYQENKNYIIGKSKEYYKKNKRYIQKYKKEAIICRYCNAISTINHIKRHEQSKKCLEMQDNMKFYKIVCFINDFEK